MKKRLWLIPVVVCVLAMGGYLVYNKVREAARLRALQQQEQLERQKQEQCLRDMLDWTHESAMVPMRDGVKLCTELFLPQGKGDGPWPVVLQRTPYSRWDIKDYLAAMQGATFAVVTQNQRGCGGSPGAKTFPDDSFDNEINDSYDAIEWIAAQKWCNGKVGMIGTSGHGLAAFNALWSGAPHLVAVETDVTADNAYLYWCYTNGVRRVFYNWLHRRNIKTASWPRPTTHPFDLKARQAFLAEHGAKCQVSFKTRTGWYDLFSEAALDAFQVLAPNGKCHIVIGPTGHGVMGGDLKYPDVPPPDVQARTLKQWLTEDAPKERGCSTLTYYLMGDTRDSAAPGNIWKVTHVWPVPHTLTSFYLHQDGTLTAAPPTQKEASRTYTYDPQNPVPTLGGNHNTGSVNGPHDQRPLFDRPEVQRPNGDSLAKTPMISGFDRKDVLRFVSEALAEPLAITGKVRFEIHFSSDVSDTEFVATLVDIYPDGYEALVRQSACLARYWQGLDKPAPIEKGKVYQIEMDMWSTALVFNKGHRIALLVASSSKSAYEVHPNTYEPISSMRKAQVAHNTIHLSAGHASRLILPVIPRESYAK